jgi:hypothetical protein
MVIEDRSKWRCVRVLILIDQDVIEAGNAMLKSSTGRNAQIAVDLDPAVGIRWRSGRGAWIAASCSMRQQVVPAAAKVSRPAADLLR